MNLNSSSKYWLATVGFAVTLFFAFEYFWMLTTAPHPANANPRLLLEGAVLLVAATLTILIRAYYRKDRFATGTPSESASEIAALGYVARDKLKHITVTILVSSIEYEQLLKLGKLQLRLDRFHQPIRRQDTVRVCVGSGSLERCLRTTIAEIDGVNQEARLELQGIPVTR